MGDEHSYSNIPPNNDALIPSDIGGQIQTFVDNGRILKSMSRENLITFENFEFGGR
jgi:hypothetical protein